MHNPHKIRVDQHPMPALAVDNNVQSEPRARVAALDQLWARAWAMGPAPKSRHGIDLFQDLLRTLEQLRALALADLAAEATGTPRDFAPVTK